MIDLENVPQLIEGDIPVLYKTEQSKKRGYGWGRMEIDVDGLYCFNQKAKL